MFFSKLRNVPEVILADRRNVVDVPRGVHERVVCHPRRDFAEVLIPYDRESVISQ